MHFVRYVCKQVLLRYAQFICRVLANTNHISQTYENHIDIRNEIVYIRIREYMSKHSYINQGMKKNTRMRRQGGHYVRRRKKISGDR